MTYDELRKEAQNLYAPAFAFKGVFSHRIFLNLEHISGVLLCISAFISMVGTFLPEVIIHHQYVVVSYGSTLLLLGMFLACLAIVSFYNSYYFKDVSDGNKDYVEPQIDFELGYLLNETIDADPVRSFLLCDNGIMIMIRAGIVPQEVGDFLVARKSIISTSNLVFANDKKNLSYGEYVEILVDTDQEFKQFLFSHGIQKNELQAIINWTIERITLHKKTSRWWSRDRLARIPGIGKNWSYGQIFTLEKYMRDVPYYSGALAVNDGTHDVYGGKELKELEAILVRSTETNVFLIGDDLSGNIGIISRLNRMIEEGVSFPELRNKRIILLDTDVLTINTRSKGEFEAELIKLMREAINAGNIILVFPNFPAFMSSAKALGSDVVSLLDPYLVSGNVQIVGMTGVDGFHEEIEPDAVLMQRFDKILIQEIDESHTVRVLEAEIIPFEYKSNITFTYLALVAIAESARRYFPDAIMPDKAVTLLQELAPKMIAKGHTLIKKEDVLALIETKTGIPVGEVGDVEKEKLLGLEAILHKRIVGQDEAVVAISNAVRRARSGINNPNRPLGSFLFLGPTGVGKTETTKALADVFFKDEQKIERLDMSEYSTPDALNKLIGSFEKGKAGVLSSMIREHPYGILLLDEFEKTTPEVMNLFLQILDEGSFSDMAGKHVSAKNLLIVATSNAGSDLIFKVMQEGGNLSASKDQITEEIIKNHVFKPELLNRFDGVILFHPLESSHLEQIARNQLEGLKKRLAERGFALVITDELVAYVTKYGTDPKFGARPMNRAIQDKVEQIIAEKLIRGDIKQGSEIVLGSADFV